MLPSVKNIDDLSNKIWYIIRPTISLNLKKHVMDELKENKSEYEIDFNDIIKLGRVKYVVTECKINGKLKSIEDNSSIAVIDLIKNYDEDAITKESDIVCKYCLNFEGQEEDPLLKLCNCSKSMSVHYKCVKAWIKNNLTKITNDFKTVTSYNMKSFNCDICKFPYACK